MTATDINSQQIRDGNVGRDDLNTTDTGLAVITKLIAGSNVSITSTGVDPGTGDVTINFTGGGGGTPGSMQISDSLGTFKVVIQETNAAMTDVVNFALSAFYSDSNAAQTEAVKATILGAGLSDTLAAQTEVETNKVTYTASGSFVVPTGVTSITVVCRGGGKGGAVGTTTGGTGGAGGDLASDTITVTPGETLTLTVAAAPAAGGNGQDTVILRGATALVRAKGGGSASTNLGSNTKTGAAGTAGALLGAGGVGGGAAGFAANGSGQTGGAASGGYPAGGNGGAAAAVGTAPGGGSGGGAGSATSPGAATVGTRGEMYITWTDV